MVVTITSPSCKYCGTGFFPIPTPAGVPVAIRNAGGRRLRADPEFVTVKVRGGVDVVSNLNPQEDLDLYVNYVPFQEQSYPVLKPEVDVPFEVLEITPSQVNLVSR